MSVVVYQRVLETTGTRTLAGDLNSRTMEMLSSQLYTKTEPDAAQGFKTVSFGQRNTL